MKNNRLIGMSILFVLFLCLSCSQAEKQTKSPTVQPEPQEQSTFTQRDSSTGTPSIEDAFPYPWYVNNVFQVFTHHGISSYYALNKHVPASFDNYINSGIPMLIPNDYVTGKPYHLVNSIDINDTTGFTFSSDGVDNCTFEFVIKNNKTNTNQIHTISFDSNYFQDYKNGILSKTEYYFDKVKREYCVRFFTYYGYIYLNKYHRAPINLVEMLKNEGIPVEAGWKWSPKPDSNEYFEFGIDASKLRCYHIQRSGKTPSGKESIVIQQMHEDIRTNSEPVEGVDRWAFSSKDAVPPDVITLNKFISSDNFYDGYLQLTK